MLDDLVLQNYIEHFLGYGTPDGRYWFVGIEEGGGTKEEDLRDRLRAWQTVGSGPIVGLHTFHRALGALQFSGDHPEKIQATWRGIITAVLTAKGMATDPRAVGSYQGNSFGSETGETCLLEFFPLPCRNMRTWPYSKCSKIDYLGTKQTYRDHVSTLRTEALRDLILKKGPVTVVFYGRSLRKRWRSIVGEPFAPVNGCHAIEKAALGKTNCFLVPHPMAHGNQQGVFLRLGELLKEYSQNRH